MLILHPLSRVNEIAVEVDDDPRAVYFKQVQYAVYVRMALILTLLEVKACYQLNEGFAGYPGWKSIVICVMSTAASPKKRPQRQDGQKDIIKVECSPRCWIWISLGFIDHNITVNIIRDGEIVAKKPLTLPKNHQCDPLQESRCIIIYRAGTGSGLLPSRRGKRDLPLPVLRGEIPSFQ